MHNRRVDEPVKIKRVITRMGKNRINRFLLGVAFWRGGLGHLGGFLVKAGNTGKTEKTEIMLSSKNFAEKLIGIEKFHRLNAIFP